MNASKPDWSERRKYERFAVNISATVRIVTSDTADSFKIWNATINDASRGGCGISMSTRTDTSQEDLERMFTRPRMCYVFCQFPGSHHTSTLYGQIMWVHVENVSDGMQIRLGISLDRSDTGELLRFFDELEGLS